MIFKTYNSDKVAQAFFNGYFFASLFLGFTALYGFVSGAGIFATFYGLLYIIIVALLSLNKTFRGSPFAIPFCFFTFLFFNIPAAFILIEGGDYIYGTGLASTPFLQSAYQEALPWGFLFLSVCWFAVWCGIVTASSKRRKINEEGFSSIKLAPVLLTGAVVLVITWLGNQRFAIAQMSGTEYSNSLLSLIFFDNAHLAMAGLLLAFKLNEQKDTANLQKINLLIFLIFIGFVAVQFMAGSKAAIMTRFVLLVLYPLSFFREYPDARISFPSPKFLVILALISLPMFLIALIRRDPSVSFAAMSEFNVGVTYDVFSQIFYRFSHGGIDRFLLIFQSFIINTPDPGITIDFMNYLAKNTLNLILPGTPFPEAYAPSSQLFPQVIEYNLLGGDVGRKELIMSLNTQPYTMFGVFMIIFGFAAPVFLCLFTFGFIFIYGKFKNVFLKITMIIFFAGALSSYGIETTIGDSVHLFASVLLLYFLIRILSMFKVILPDKMDYIPESISVGK